MPVPTDLSSLTHDFQWEDVGCPLCGGRRNGVLVEAPDPQEPDGSPTFRVVRCSDCGLAFTNPRPTVETIALAYSTDYGPHQSPKPAARRRRGWWSRQLARLRGRRELAWHGQGRLLDFGCGSGSFLVRMREAGWQAVGLDASPTVVQQLRSEMQLTAFVGSLPHAELRPASFDVITMWQALEHVHDPLAVLHAARQLLVPGGRLVVSVPNLASAPFRWFGPDWFGLDLPRHLLHFTPDTLARLVQQAGFQVEQIRGLRHPSWLQNSARRAERRGVLRGWRRALLARSVCRVASALCVARGVSDAMLLTATAGESSR